MELNYYQERAMTTCTESCKNYVYMAENLVGEVGEFMSKIAKAIRKGQVVINQNNIDYNFDTKQEQYEFMMALRAELGDISWMLAGIEKALGFNMEDVCQANLDKLQSRAKRGVIIGEGDNR